MTEALGTTDLKAFKLEGRVPVLLLPDGRKMTQTGPIIDYLEDEVAGAGTPSPSLPSRRSTRKSTLRRV